MADETPVAAPAEAVEQPERAAAAAGDKPANQESENVTTTDEKKTEPASANDEKKEAEAGADQAADSGNATEAKDEPAAAGEDAKAAVPEANGTPASSKKSSKDRRRSTGTADKKLNKRKSMTKITHLKVQPGEYYLARLRSYAPWPSIVCDEDMLPQSLLDTRPVTAAQPDGTYRADYADDGKRAHERTFPVMFLQSNEFAWIPNTQLTPITPAECKDVSQKNKAKGLVEAYNIASEGHDLAYFKQMLADHEAAIQQEIEEEEAVEAAKAAAKAEKEAAKEAAKEAKKAATKSKRKSKGPDTDVEMEDSDDKKAKTSKKRKNETDGDAEKPAKTPKTSTKLKLTTPKAPEEKKTASKAKKASSKKAKAAEDDSTPEVKEPEKQIDPEELKKKKEKEILFLRHKLQKGFISREMPPKEDEMATMAGYFDKLEKHADLEVSIIRSTKINKVLKMIVKLDTIPRDEEFQFRHRAMGILTSWKSVLEIDAPAPSDKESKPTANGAHKDDDAADTPKMETEEEKETESKTANDDTPMPDAEKADESEPKESEDKPAEEKTVEATA